MNYENTHAMMEFTEVLKCNPDSAYDFISIEGYRFSKEGLIDIIKEILYSMHYHVDNRYYDGLYAKILGDAQIELDESYDGEYQEYTKLIEETE